MGKIIVEMEFDHDEFEDLTDEEKRESVITLLETGAEATRCEVEVTSIQFIDEQ